LVAAILCFALLGALAFVIGVFVHSFGSIPVHNLGALVEVALLFAVLGAIFGTVLALDRSVDAPAFTGRFIRRFEAPVLRTFICAALGAAAVLLVRSWDGTSFPATWSIAGAVAGAVLGWYGWRWAKYVDF
jgi:hypothetical protein